MSLAFSAQPGRRERHLRRRHDNLLFGESARQVTDAQIAAARSADDQEAREFAADFRALLADVAELAAQVDSEVVLDLETRIDRLYEQCAGLGGVHDSELQSLARLHELVLRAIRTGARGDPLADRELQEREAARALHMQMLRHTLVADLLHPDSPIGADELVPTLLSEEEPALRAALTLLDPQQRRTLCTQARALLLQCTRNGNYLPSAQARLQIMEEDLP